MAVGLVFIQLRYEFQTRPQTAPDSDQLSQILQMKNGNPRLLPTSQKIETISDFVLIICFIHKGDMPDTTKLYSESIDF